LPLRMAARDMWRLARMERSSYWGRRKASGCGNCQQSQWPRINDRSQFKINTLMGLLVQISKYLTNCKIKQVDASFYTGAETT